MEVPLFLEIPEFPYNESRIRRRKPAFQNQLDSFIRFDRTLTSDRQTDRHSARISIAWI